MCGDKRIYNDLCSVNMPALLGIKVINYALGGGEI